jgi:Zn-dependent protease with chaperone function
LGLVVGLLAYAAATVFGAPSLLTLGRWRMRYPRLALAAWHGVFVSGLVAACGSLVISIVLALSLSKTGSGSSSASGSWFGPTVIVLCAWGALAAVGGLAALIFTRAEPMKAALRAANEQLMLLSATSAYRTVSVGGVTVTFVQSELPVAVSMPGPERTVVITSRIEAVLPPAQVRAVIEHERAHVVQRHGWIAQLAHLNLLCVPKLLGAREFEQATQLLIELIADDCAARVCGADAVSAALTTVGSLTGDESMGLRALRVRARPPRATGLSPARRGADAAPERAF